MGAPDPCRDAVCPGLCSSGPCGTPVTEPDVATSRDQSRHVARERRGKSRHRAKKVSILELPAFLEALPVERQPKGAASTIVAPAHIALLWFERNWAMGRA